MRVKFVAYRELKDRTIVQVKPQQVCRFPNLNPNLNPNSNPNPFSFRSTKLIAALGAIYDTRCACLYQRNPVKNSPHTHTQIESAHFTHLLRVSVCVWIWVWVRAQCLAMLVVCAAHTLNNRIKNDNPKIRRHQRAERRRLDLGC